MVFLLVKIKYLIIQVVLIFVLPRWKVYHLNKIVRQVTILSEITFAIRPLFQSKILLINFLVAAFLSRLISLVPTHWENRGYHP